MSDPVATVETLSFPGFAVRNLSTLGYARGFTLWQYRAGAETLEALITPGYFDSAQDMLCPGDMVVLSGRFGGSIVFVTALRPRVVVSQSPVPCEVMPWRPQVGMP